MHINNKCGWIEWFSVPNILLEFNTGLTRQAIFKSRNVLKQYGLIDFRLNGTKATEYKMNTMSNSLQDSLQVGCQVGLQDSLQVGLQDSLQVGCTLNKLNKTKLNNKGKENTKRKEDSQKINFAEYVSMQQKEYDKLVEERRRKLYQAMYRSAKQLQRFYWQEVRE